MQSDLQALRLRTPKQLRTLHNSLSPRVTAVLTQIVAVNSAPESSTCTIDGEQATAKRCCENQIMWLRNESRAGTPLMVHGGEVGTPEFFLAVRPERTGPPCTRARDPPTP